MSNIGKRIRIKREELGYTQEELAKLLGYRNKSTIAKIENGTNDITQSKVVDLARVLNSSVAYLMGLEEELNDTPGTVRIPVLGRVAAGTPINMVKDIIDWEEIPEKLAGLGEYFALRINGDSMEPKFSIGDVVIVRQQSDADSGDIVIAAVNGDEATCKRLMKYAEGIALVSTNPIYPPMYFSQSDRDTIPVTILGKVVELRAKF